MSCGIFCRVHGQIFWGVLAPGRKTDLSNSGAGRLMDRSGDVSPTMCCDIVLPFHAFFRLIFSEISSCLPFQVQTVPSWSTKGLDSTLLTNFPTVRRSPLTPSLLPTMTAVIPKHLILFHKARRLCIILGGIYIFLVLLGATPFAQAQ
jgi:hypothetical protein